ncbi:MAG TPA: NAD(P)-dependent oxidoreductase [Rhizomicrobium sp.]|jgi:phosphoglycerate dehydrogenase-like enzyme/predicted dehydrogenase
MLAPTPIVKGAWSLSNDARDTNGTIVKNVPSILRALVIGAGPAASHLHLPVLVQLRDQGRIILSTVCDLDAGRAEAARRKFGFSDSCGDAHQAMAHTDIDLVYIFGSAQMHWSLGREALRRGKHLFVEKPIAPSYEVARQMTDAALAARCVVVGGLNRRFYEPLALAKARGGQAGWRYAEVTFHKAESGKPVPFGAGSWLTANGIHALDALLFVMGGLPAQIASFAGRNAEVNVFSALMRWPNGAQAVFLCNNNAGIRQEDYVFHRDGETCRASETDFTLETGGRVFHEGPFAQGESIKREHAAFLDATQSGLSPRHSLADLAPSLFLAELIESGFSGSVRLPHPRSEPESDSQPSILVEESGRLLPALGRHLPHCRLVTLADIADTPRPDIVAALIGGGAKPLPDGILDMMPNLSVAGIMGLDLTRYAPEVFHSRGITLFNASDSYAESVAEFALGLAILGRRRAFTAHQVMRDGGWGVVSPVPGIRGVIRRIAHAMRPYIRRAGLEPLVLPAWRQAAPIMGASNGGGARDLKGARVGLVGWGANAQAFAARLIQAGAQVQAWSEHADPEALHAADVTPASLAEILSADIVSLHRALSPRTRHCLDAKELEQIRAGAVLINVARGALIEPKALLARLRRGDIFACLDTFELEPLAVADPLRRLPNVFLTSHIAGGSPDMHASAAEEVVSKVKEHLHKAGIFSLSAPGQEAFVPGPKPRH